VNSKVALSTYQVTCFEESMKDENWFIDMDEEMNSIDKKDTWDLVELLDDKY